MVFIRSEVCCWDSLDAMSRLQKWFSRGQTIPVVGVIPSAGKLIVSISQCALGSLASIGVAAVTGSLWLIQKQCVCISGNTVDDWMEYTEVAVSHAVMGFGHTLYAVANIATLTGIGMHIKETSAYSFKK